MSIDDDLFGQTYTQLMANVAGNNPNFQLLVPSAPWWWSTAPSGQISAQEYQFVNQIPQWSAVGAFSPTGRTVYDAYRTLLQYVSQDVPANLLQQATNAHNALVAANNQYQSDLTARNYAWQTMLNNMPSGVPAPDFTTWAQSSGWTGTLAADSVAIAKAQQTYTAIIGQENPLYQQATGAIVAPPDSHTPKPGWTLMDQGDGNIVPTPNWQVGSTGQDWVALLSQGGNATTVTLDASKGAYDWSSSWAQGNLSGGYSFFGAYLNGSWSQMALAQDDSSVTVSITLKGSALVPVTPDNNWYYNSYLKALGSNPAAFNSPYTPTGGGSPVFGQGGILPLVITGLVVGYQPSITATMSSDSFQQNASQYEAAAGVRIGPWVFGEGSGGHSSDTWTSDAATNTFTSTSNATYPFVMGVTVGHPGID